MTRSLWLFNLLLALLAIVLLAALVDSILDHEPTPADGRRLSLGSRKAAPAPEADPRLLRQTSVPDLSAFEIIVQKDVFKNPFAEPVAPPAGSGGVDQGAALLEAPPAGVDEVVRPIHDRKAVYVTAVGESPSEENQILLERRAGSFAGPS